MYCDQSADATLQIGGLARHGKDAGNSMRSAFLVLAYSLGKFGAAGAELTYIRLLPFYNQCGRTQHYDRIFPTFSFSRLNTLQC
jgi:hypothetical protein